MVVRKKEGITHKDRENDISTDKGFQQYLGRLEVDQGRVIDSATRTEEDRG